MSQRLGADHVDIATASSGGAVVIARHDLAPDGAGVMVRDHGHVIALEQLVLAGHDTSRPHRKKERIHRGQQPAQPPRHSAPPNDPPSKPSTTTS